MNNPSRSVNAFYDAVAPAYNGHMTDSDNRVRDLVHQLFIKNLATGTVLDFGGGTGLDLPWLVEHGYKVFFLEPSENMRSVARQNNISAQITFVSENTDFMEWSENQRPFNEKVNGIIANFAVLNCIANIDQLFDKLSLLSAPGCHFIMTVIDPRPGKMMKHYPFSSVARMLFRSTLQINNQHEGNVHPTYIHSLSSIKKASKKYFNLESIISPGFSSFAILVFKKR